MNTIQNFVIICNFYTNEKYNTWLFISSIISICLNACVSVALFMVFIQKEFSNKWIKGIIVPICLILISPLIPYLIYFICIFETFRNKYGITLRDEPESIEKECKIQARFSKMFYRMMGFYSHCILFIILQCM